MSQKARAAPDPWILIEQLKQQAVQLRPAGRPHGSSLIDFLTSDTPTGLTAAEKELLTACFSGYRCAFTIDKGDKPDRREALREAVAQNAIRAGLIRFLALGGDEFWPVHSNGVELSGAFITTDAMAGRYLNLQAAMCRGRLILEDCVLDGALWIEDASLTTLVMRGTWCIGEDGTAISGNRSKLSGSLFLDEAFTADGEVRFFSAKIDGGVVCAKATINGKMVLNSSRIGGDVDCGSADITGDFHASNARINGNVLCKAASFGAALMLKTATIHGRFEGDNVNLAGEFDITGASIGGELHFNDAVLAAGVSGQGLSVRGDVSFVRLTSKGPVSLAGCNVGGSIDCTQATFGREPAVDVAFDISAGKIKGNVIHSGAKAKKEAEPGAELLVTCFGCFQVRAAEIGGDLNLLDAAIIAKSYKEGTPAGDDLGYAINGQGAVISGSLFLTRSTINGTTWLYGAKMSGMTISATTFNVLDGQAFVADNATVAGAIAFFPSDWQPTARRCVVNGAASLTSARCGDLALFAVLFNNPKSMTDGNAIALDCTGIEVAGRVILRNAGATPFEARGRVSFSVAKIGQHFYGGGGRFINPKGTALEAEAARIGGCVFLGRGDDTIQPVAERLKLSTAEKVRVRTERAFCSSGKVTFVGATVELQFNCQWGHFINARPNKFNDAYADTALDLSVAKIGDTLLLGIKDHEFGAMPNLAVDEEDPREAPVLIEGTLNLGGATVGVLTDDGLIKESVQKNWLDGQVKWGLAESVPCPDGVERRCNLILDLFSYQRLDGTNACDAALRKDWLRRQPNEKLETQFSPQPFEQLTSVIRAMGNDDAADDIALYKKQSARRASLWWPGPGLLRPLTGFLSKLWETVFLDWFVGYGYKTAHALAILVVVGWAFGMFYGAAYRQGDIVPVDTKILDKTCPVWSPKKCRDSDATPQFNPWIYSADVMIPIVGLGQKAAWQPGHDTKLKLAVLGYVKPPFSLVYDVQLVETVLGWIGGLLLASYVTGLLAKE